MKDIRPSADKRPSAIEQDYGYDKRPRPLPLIGCQEIDRRPKDDRPFA